MLGSYKTGSKSLVQMLSRKNLPWHMASAKDGPWNLPSKFGQNSSSSSSDIADIDIWLILPRSSPPLEICRWFPQIVFILPTCVRPINVGFSNLFCFVYQIKGFWILLSKKKLKKINLRVRFLPLKIAIFGGFENDNILSSKSYTIHGYKKWNIS